MYVYPIIYHPFFVCLWTRDACDHIKQVTRNYDFITLWVKMNEMFCLSGEQIRCDYTVHKKEYNKVQALDETTVKETV